MASMWRSWVAVGVVPVVLVVAACSDSSTSGEADGSGSGDASAVPVPSAVGADAAGADAFAAVCGDGTCDKGETFLSCRDDCEPGPWLVCLADHCKDALDACLGDDACKDALSCAGSCGGDGGCLDGCLDGVPTAATFIAKQLFGCGGAAGCLALPVSGDSCAGRCGEYDASKACQCDTGCAITGDCCEDYDAVCGSSPGGTPDGSGGGSGEPDAAGGGGRGEPDAGGGGGGGVQPPPKPADVASCLEQECGDAVAACTDDACQKALDCIDGCGEDALCAAGCLQHGAFSPAKVAVGTCGFQKGCLAAQGGGSGGGPGGGGGGPGGGGGGGSANGAVACLLDACADAVQGCLADSGCAGVWQCITGCADTQCIAGCLQGAGFNPALVQLGMCAYQQGCLSGGSGGSGGGPGGGGAIGDVFQCVLDACPDEVAACEQDAACADALSCAQSCDSQQCVLGCFQGAGFGGPIVQLGMCAYQSNCFGGGAGGGGGGPGGGSGGGGGGATLGALQCIQDQCGDEVAACLQDSGCAEALACAATCDSTQCLLGCFQGAGFSGTVIQLGMCAYQSGCVGGGGNGSGGFGFGGGGSGGMGGGSGGMGGGSGGMGGGSGGGNGGGSVADTLACVQDACPDELAACEQDAACAEALDCADACDTDQCALGCFQGAGFGGAVVGLATCAYQSGCIGGGGGFGFGGP